MFSALPSITLMCAVNRCSVLAGGISGCYMCLVLHSIAWFHDYEGLNTCQEVRE